MTDGIEIVSAMAVGLVILFCCRHFFVQLIAIKLTLDSLVFLVTCFRAPRQMSGTYQAASWIITSIGLLSLFTLMAAGLRSFSRSKTLSVEGDDD